MKIAITGHTKGIGKNLFDRFSSCHTVLGFSRSNGYNIITHQSQIIEQTKDCDIFINNAFAGPGQLNLFNELFDLWKQDHTKTIVNINSVSHYLDYISVRSNYSVAKNYLYQKTMSKMFEKDKKCRIISFSPGPIDTPMDNKIPKDKKLTVDEFCDIVEYAINLPQHIELGDVGVWKINT